MKRHIALLATIVLAVVVAAAPAGAMQPPGEPAQENFGCFEGEDNPVAGHPGAPGIADAASRVKLLTGNPFPTAWNAVDRAGPIDFGSC